VREEGYVGAGDTAELIDRDDKSVTIAEFIETYLNYMHEPEQLMRILASRDLSGSWRRYLEEALRKAEPGIGSTAWTGFRSFLGRTPIGSAAPQVGRRSPPTEC